MTTVRRILRRLRDEDGIAAVEFVIMAPAMILLLGLVALYGRTEQLSGELESAARDAARSASMQATLADAQESATLIARDALGDGTCSNANLATVNGSFDSGETLDVTITCTYSVAGLRLPLFPASLTKSATFYSTIDPNRGLG